MDVTLTLTGALKWRSSEGTGFSATSVKTNSCCASETSNTFVVSGSPASPCSNTPQAVKLQE